MKAVEIKKGIYWVGAIDWDLRNFHGYLTQKGSTYNAFLIVDEKITLVDTVKSYCADEMIKRISSIVDPSKIDYIVSNHVEMDHSGAISKIVELAPNVEIVSSAKGQTGLKEHYRADWNFKIVKTGDKLELGSKNLDFILTPMVHWPDNMVAYMPEEKILFSNDSFGQHLSSSERFDDSYPLDIVMEEAKKYYANIVMPFGMQVKRELDDAKKLDIEIIAPSHGVVWREHTAKIIEEYTKWASNETEKKALVVYDTMWGSTEKIAKAIQSAFEDKAYKTALYNLQYNHISDIMTEVLSAEYICVGSPTLNNNLLPNVSAFLTYLKGLAPKNRKAIAFGSFGWGGQSIGQVADILEASKFDLVESVRCKYIPSEDQLEEIIKNIKEKV